VRLAGVMSASSTDVCGFCSARAAIAQASSLMSTPRRPRREGRLGGFVNAARENLDDSPTDRFAQEFKGMHGLDGTVPTVAAPLRSTNLWAMQTIARR
jgi:hypothetical protein